MTPVGVAMIVGGITTLIVFRRALFGRAGNGAGEARRRGSKAGADTAADQAGDAVAAGAGRKARRGRATRETPRAGVEDAVAATGRNARRGRTAGELPAAPPAGTTTRRAPGSLRPAAPGGADAAGSEAAPATPGAEPPLGAAAGSGPVEGPYPAVRPGAPGENADSGPGSRRFWPTSAALGPASDAAYRAGEEPGTLPAPEFTGGAEAYDPARDGATAPFGMQQEGIEMPFDSPWPEAGTPIAELLGGGSAVAGLPAVEQARREPAMDEGIAGLGRGRGMLQRFAALEDIDAPSSGRFDLIPPGAGPADVDLLPLDGLHAVPERGGAPELDIDPELDRVADEPVSHSLELHHLEAAGAYEDTAGTYDGAEGGYGDAEGAYDLAGGFLADHFPVPDELAADVRLPGDGPGADLGHAGDWSGGEWAGHERDGGDLGWPAGQAQSPEDPALSAGFDAVDEAASGGFAAPGAETTGRQWGGGYGDRAEAWSRPEYSGELEPISGEYWMPVPEGSYDPEYGWPEPAETQPETHLYAPAAGAEDAEPEPAPVVPQWPPVRPDDRVEAPRPLSERDGNGLPVAAGEHDDAGQISVNADRHGAVLLDDNGRRDDAEWPQPASAPVNQSLDEPIWRVSDLPDTAMPDLSWAPGQAAEEAAPRRVRRPAAVIRRRRNVGSASASEGLTQIMPALDLEATRNARPRPRPRASNAQAEPRSTVYVSRHAAEPN
ncbi:hypothetical protein [Actinoplanes sp. NPDC026623]|uniref:hypothetical protein n=1 Tax=Actinoplanes sp. NPDC026623 TaxID=3155610 RepID=UPI0033E8748F